MNLNLHATATAKFLLTLFATVTLAGTKGAELAVEWPRLLIRNGVTNIVYQPQLESWDYVTLKAVCAVAVQPNGEAQPTFGRIEIAAKTTVDRANRTVYLEQAELVQGSFPSAGAQEQTYLANLSSLLPREVKTISLDRLEANLAILQARRRAAAQPLNNTPPTILFSTKPALLVLVDGPPVYRLVSNTSLERVINTRALILRDRSGRHFLHLFDGYVQADGLAGPWTLAGQVSAEVQRAEAQVVKARQVDLLAGQDKPGTTQKPTLKSTPIPAIYVMTVPAELIVTRGEPQWTPLAGTQLLNVANTVSHLFKDGTTQRIYVLVSGRWFSAMSLDGPWEFVPGTALPKDFANLPDDSPQENVKAAVPGTQQAEEAVIANGIPNTVKVDRRRATMDPPPQYEGTLQLAPIDGTSLYYVRNCQTPVIRVDANTWYACQNGVWFVAGGSSGPWAVASAVPSPIYSIPASSPLHYVVYVRVYRFDADSVWVGTTPGYCGTVIGADGTVVYGTGYSYPPYIGQTMYVCYPVTYGYGSDPCWTPWVGWSYGFDVAWATDDDWYWWCACPVVPYWGSYWYPCYGYYYNAYGGITAWGPYGWAGTTGYIYHQCGPWTGVSRAAAGYNAWTGNQWATSYGRAYNSTTGTRAVGQRGAVHNVYTGNYAYGGRGAYYNAQTGAAGAGRKVTWGNDRTGKEGTAGRAAIYNPKSGDVTHISGAKGDSGGYVKVDDHLVVGKDGNYYRPDGHGGWEQIVRPPTSRSGPGEGNTEGRTDATVQKRSGEGAPVLEQQRVQELNSQYNTRQMGAQRQQSFQMNRPGFRGGGTRR